LSKVGNFGVDPFLLFPEAVDGGGQDVTRESYGHWRFSIVAKS
jgi:hypothetical protein